MGVAPVVRTRREIALRSVIRAWCVGKRILYYDSNGGVGWVTVNFRCWPLGWISDESKICPRFGRIVEFWQVEVREQGSNVWLQSGPWETHQASYLCTDDVTFEPCKKRWASGIGEFFVTSCRLCMYIMMILLREGCSLSLYLPLPSLFCSTINHIQAPLFHI
jgi:hypothetical protein